MKRLWRKFVATAVLTCAVVSAPAFAQPAPAPTTPAPATATAPAVPAPVAATPAATGTPTVADPSAATPSAAVAPSPADSAAVPAATPPAAAAPSAAAPGTAAPAKTETVNPEANAWYTQLQNKPWDKGGTAFLPSSVNSAADDANMMFYAVLGLSFFFFFAIAGALVYFVVRYRHRPGHKAQPSAAHNDALEITWTVIPTIICVFLFVYGWRSYVRIVTPPAHAVEIQVTAWKWGWQFQHNSNGVKDDNLHVPVNTPVRLVMTAQDVLHSFYIPVMRVKQDLVPRRYTYSWFQATKPGTYRMYCTEYCGMGHSQMSKVVVVHEPGKYEQYLADKAAIQQNLPPVEVGKSLYTAKGCNACHSVDGAKALGPTWAGAFGKPVPLASGASVTMDENYIRESIVDPAAKVHAGFPPAMPPFGNLTDKELNGLIEYIKSLK